MAHHDHRIHLNHRKVPPPWTNSSVWPMPKQFDRSGNETMWIDASSFRFTTPSGTPPSSSPLAAAFDRFFVVCFGSHRTSANRAASGAGGIQPLSELIVRVQDQDTPLVLGVDESYTLTITQSQAPASRGAKESGGEGSTGVSSSVGGWTATLDAPTLYGAYHGLETFAQLVRFDFSSQAYKVQGAPLSIVDAPRFAWRELMVDTARHFLPPVVLNSVVDSMCTAKLNVLHLHLVDSQAFPLSLPSVPQLVKGA